MADEFWNSVFDKLKDDYELLKLICADTSDSDLLSWVKPNQKLWTRCGRFIHKNTIHDKNSFIKELVAYSEKDSPLRKIILLTWVNKNQPSMDFFKLPGNEESIKKLSDGQFGGIEKIRILSRIEPRKGAEKLYKKILEENTESPSIPMVSEAELEAACQAKTAIDTVKENNQPSISPNQFVELISEELKNIKENLENITKINQQLKAENKNLREETNKRQSDIAAYSSKLENSINEAKTLKKELDELKAINSSLSSQLLAAKQEIANKPAPLLSESEINDLRFRLGEAEKEKEQLQQVVTNRDASLARLKEENEALHRKTDNIEDQSNIIAGMQKKLAEFNAKETTQIERIAGQLVSKTRYDSSFGELAGKKCWLFISTSGTAYYLSLEMIAEAKAVPEEYLIAEAIDGKFSSIQSLETEKREIYGYVKLIEGKYYINTDEEGNIPIKIDVSDKWVERTARAVYLPESDNREEGIYKVEVLPATAKLKKNLPPNSKHNKKSAIQEEKEQCFNGQRVMIFGGDRVAIEYEKALGKLGLEARWYSGFSLLSEISLGLSKPDLMVIVIKQISHALLREANAYAEKNNIPIVYSSRRGVSAVVELVGKTLNSNTKN